MPLSGALFVAGAEVPGEKGSLHAVAAATGEKLLPPFEGSSERQLRQACGAAALAFDAYRATSLEERAQFLEAIAIEIDGVREELIARGHIETGLSTTRLGGECNRTVNQLRFFASLVRGGEWLGLTLDPALPERTPVPRPDLRSRMVPVGPVAVFGASNFPLAFSVAGGDTASALAAGCPVVVKAHPAHPGLSELVARAITAAVAATGMPTGVFSMLHDSGIAIGQALVADPDIKAVGFTGSRRGGLALQAIAQARPEPIPVFGELSSVNPVIVLPHALRSRGQAIAHALVASMTLDAGQYCTGPGLLFLIDGPERLEFTKTAASQISIAFAATMLNAGIAQAFDDGVAALRANGAIELARGLAGAGQSAALFAVDAAALAKTPALLDEVFGSAATLIHCRDCAELIDTVEALEGQLTIAIHFDPDDEADVRSLLPIVERKAGRLIANGFGTGVEIAHAMVHGGPFPATTDGRSTSVGARAIERWMRPVCYQNFPQSLLPASLCKDSLAKYPSRIDGRLTHP